jgi:hypothetical protein
MKRTFKTLHGAVIAAIAAAVLGTASVGASATPSATPATLSVDRSGNPGARPVRIAADQTSSATPILVILPTTVVTEPTVLVGPMTPTAESPAIARKEATAALAQAKSDCRRQAGGEQKSCLGAAQDDYRSQMAYARSGNR